MFPQIAIERAAGALVPLVLVPLVLVLLATSLILGAGRVGIDTRSEYFYATGPHSWQVVATQHRDRLADGLAFQAAAGALAMATAALIYLMFRAATELELRPGSANSTKRL